MSEPKVILTLSEYKKLMAKPDVYHGTTEPPADLGKDGDFYIMMPDEEEE